MYVLSFNYTIILYHMWVQSFDHIMLIRIVLYYVIVFRIWWRHYHQFLHYYYSFLLRMITLLTVLFISYVNICATNIFLSLSFWVTDFHIFYDFHISYYPPLYVCVTALLYLLFSRTFLFQALWVPANFSHIVLPHNLIQYMLWFDIMCDDTMMVYQSMM